ncbi:prospero homeobox protein 1-like [Pimephales promelas]|uniref:prospero homeobox protein 1-like n=1 Tax=Pimephales promelas TaxID=90988 RepID=UPI0019558F8D|nr:prospero homeobox protein 1-like [Pimephales promelas]XP_039537452.1 prospero homeobox protein 1-like [Pimephales promelas]KAG1925896.1 prospero homeobox protein [Pimephales promelas]
MPAHDTEFHLNLQTKRRRVDIGVKRTSSAATSTHTASAVITVTRAAKSTAMNSHHSWKQDVLERQGAHLKHRDSSEAKSNVLRKLLKRASSYEDNMIPFSGATIITKLLNSNKATTETGGREPIFSRKAEPEPPQEDTCSSSSQESVKECLSPFGQNIGTRFDSERLNEEHLQAKRARVENIIRGMNHSPNVMTRSIPSGKEHERDGEGETEVPARENKRKQKLPQQQSVQRLVSTHTEQKVEERRQLKLQLEDLQKQLRQIQEKFFRIYDSSDSEADGGNLSEDSAQSDGLLEHQSYVADQRNNLMAASDPECVPDEAREHVLLDGEMAKRESSLRSKGLKSVHGVGKHLAETLKQELNSVMSQVIDTVVNVFSKPPRQLLQVFPSLPATQDRFAFNGDNPNFHTANQRLQCFGDVIFPRPFDSFVGVPLPSANEQMEARPLVVQKCVSEHHQSTDLGAQSGHPHPSLHTSSLSGNTGFISQSFRHPFPLPLLGYSFQSTLGASSSIESPDLMDLSRETTSLQKSLHLMHNRSCSPDYSDTSAEGLSLIKSECRELNPLSGISPPSESTIQEGLSPSHLKKAKLMFFYSRYPSSSMLKMYFSDVKFNRCITSQLIKWFSNFREFYYIQIEKFARQAINDDVVAADDIRVSCDSSLYKVLNMHYNKNNDFEVPERFLEVTQIALREFFNAIVACRDADPSWKKAIYKVICKLDSEVPDIFKSPSRLQELLHD